MKKIFVFSFSLIFSASAAFLLCTRPAMALSEGNAYLAAVQIKVYEIDEAGYFVLAKTGTGALIDNNGTLLTSRSLIANPARAAVSVCRPSDLNKKPDCRLAAEVITCGANADFPLCLLRVRTVAGLSEGKNNFLFLKRLNAGWPVVGERLRMINFNSSEFLETALTYVSGSAAEADFTWLELETAFGAGADGALLVNREGELAALNVDLDEYQSADPRHVLFLPPLNDWFLNMSQASAVAFSEAGRFDDFLRRQSQTRDQAEFSWADPAVRVFRPEHWEWFYPQENQLLALGPQNGRVQIVWEKNPDFSDLDYVSAIDESMADGYEFAADGFLGGLSAKKFINIDDARFGRWLIPGRDYLLTLDYQAGSDGADQWGLDKLLARLVFSFPPFVPAADQASAPAGEALSPAAEETVQLEVGAESSADSLPGRPAVFNQAPIALNNALGRKLNGRILLRVEKNGEAWYLSSARQQAYFLGRPSDAFQIMRDQGLGISNADLNKIPVGQAREKIVSRTASVFAAKHLGKIFLAVEGKGEAWYVHPTDGRRYFLGNPAQAFALLRAVSLGISEEDFARLKK